MPSTNSENLLAVGQKIAGCQVIEFLGAGGMGQVYKCEHLRLKKTVALKILPTLDSKCIKRFLREAQLAAKIDHPNVVIIYDVDQDPETRLYFIIMNFINGRNLDQIVKAHGGPIPWTQALQLVRGAAKGTAAVHAQGLIHRDIKPANIMFATTSRQAILMDFGLVRETEMADWQVTGGVAGTPVFMSPEQCRGSTNLDARSDIVSLGRTMYFLLTGRLPYNRTDPTKDGVLDILNQIMSGRVPPPIQQLNPAVPLPVAELVERAMAHDPEQRFPTAEAMVAAMGKLLKTPSLPQTVSYHPAASAPEVETANELAELPLITDVADDGPRLSKKWLAVGAGLGISLVVLLAFWLNRPQSEDSASKGSKTSAETGPRLTSKADANNMIAISAGKVYLGNTETVLRQHATAMRFTDLETNDFVRLGLERPATLADVPAFWIDKYEVTNAEYAKFVQQTKRSPPQHWKGNSPPANQEDNPVVFVSHVDALAFAAWAKKKLPTDVQWLRAFRGHNNWLYPWGNTWHPGRANVGENQRFPGTSAVSATPDDVSQFGVANMVGNADEMLRSLVEKSGLSSVPVRGANWKLSGAIYGNAAFPSYLQVGLEVNSATGFRCVREEP